jgi:phage tail sheath protein FI
MTATPTAPGVYLYEISSGVQAISGVSTSTTAFVGTALRGPINEPWQITGWGDFNTVFGGLSPKSEMSYAVWQFFQNQGSLAWIVRVGNNAVTATLPLLDGNGNPSLTFSAFDGGFAGNGVAVSIYAANDPNRFNVILTGVPNASGTSASETYSGLSMNSTDGFYVETIVNNQSRLVTVKRAPTSGAGAIVFGSASSTNAPPATAPTFTAPAQMTVIVDGSISVSIVFPAATSMNAAEIISVLSGPLAAAATVAVSATNPNAVTITSKTTGEGSSVIVLQGSPNDASRTLGFGSANGGVEIDGTAQTKPAPSPEPGTLTFHNPSSTFTLGANGTIAVALDGGRPVSIALKTSDLTPISEANLETLASRLQAAVQSARPGVAYANFTAVYKAGPPETIVLTSGTRAAGSGVSITNAGTDTTAGTIGLLTGAPALSLAQILSGGSESAFDPTNPYGTFFPASNPKGGIFALEDVQIFNILVLAGISDGATLQDAASYCETRRAFLIMDPPPGLQPPAIETYATGAGPPKSDHAALYYPYIDITDPLTGMTRPTAPSGTMAGVYALTDATRGVWKAPAGTNASLVGAINLEYNVTDAESGILNPIAINAIRNIIPYGIVSWGTRTMHGQDANPSDYKYVPVRRLALYIEQSLYQGTQWVVFEPNDATLWGQVRLSVSSFMDTLFRQGAFAGASPRDAYFVKCDADTNPSSSVSLGVLNVVVGFAPVDPAEFVIITIQQIAGQSGG